MRDFMFVLSIFALLAIASATYIERFKKNSVVGDTKEFSFRVTATWYFILRLEHAEVDVLIITGFVKY